MTNSSSYLGNKNTLKTIFKLAIPSMIGQLISVLYSIVDRIYVGNLSEIGEIALIGVGVVAPITTFITSFAYLIGFGGAPLFSISLGKKDEVMAKKILSNALIMLLIVSTILVVVFYSSAIPILKFFGASDKSLPYAKTYFYIYLSGTYFSVLTLGLNQYLIAQGDSVKAMITTIIGCILNVGLDPLLMYTFNMGIAGAALATVISQFISFLFVLFILTKKSFIKLSFGNYDIKLMGKIIRLGFSPFLIMATDSLILILLNRVLKLYGGDLADFYIEVSTIVQAFFTLVTGPLLGISSGTQPILGYNYGAKNKELIIKAEKELISFALIFTTICFLLSFILARPFAVMFIGIGKEVINNEIVDASVRFIRVFMIGIIPLSFQYVFVDGLTGLGYAKYSIWLSLFRKVGLYIPCIYLLPLIFNNVEAAFYAQCIGDIGSAICSTIVFLIVLPKILKKIDIERDVKLDKENA